jgi:hypothetical protein
MVRMRERERERGDVYVATVTVGRLSASRRANNYLSEEDHGQLIDETLVEQQ